MYKETPQLKHMDAAQKMKLQQLSINLQNTCRNAGGLVKQGGLKSVSAEELFCVFIMNGIDVDFKLNEKLTI